MSGGDKAHGRSPLILEADLLEGQGKGINQGCARRYQE